MKPLNKYLCGVVGINAVSITLAFLTHDADIRHALLAFSTLMSSLLAAHSPGTPEK